MTFATHVFYEALIWPSEGPFVELSFWVLLFVPRLAVVCRRHGRRIPGSECSEEAVKVFGGLAALHGPG